MPRHGALALCLLAFACTPEPPPPDLGPTPLRPPEEAVAAAAAATATAQQVATRRAPPVELELSDAEALPAPRGEPAEIRALTGPAAQAALALVATLPAPEPESPFRPGIRPPQAPKAAEGFPRPTPLAESAPEPFTATMSWPRGVAADPSELRVAFSRKVAGVQPGSAANRVPVELSPQLPGEWRWLDASTLTFRPTLPFPKATEYSIEIGKTLRSSDGEDLDRRVRWSFSTPPPRVVSTLPAQGDPRQGAWPRSAPIFVQFDQPVRAEQVLGTLRLEAAGRPWALRLATRDEVDRDAALRRAVAAAPPAHWVAVKAVEPLPMRAEAKVTVGPGLGSIEGELRSTDSSSFSFVAGAAFDQVQLACYWAPAPFLMTTLDFDTRLDPESFDERSFTTVPALAQQRVTLSREGERSRVTITGLPEGAGPIEIHHTVALASEDGVHPALPGELKCTPPEIPAEVVDYSSMQQLTGDGRLALWLTAKLRLRVRAWTVTPAQWSSYGERLARRLGPWHPEGSPVFDETLEAVSDRGRAWLDLSKAFGAHGGDLLVELTREGDPAPFNTLWLQRSSLQLVAKRVGTELAVLALSAADGSPLPGAQVESGGKSAVTDAAGLALLRGLSAEASVVTVRSGESSGFAPLHRAPSCRPALVEPRGASAPGTTVKVAGRACPGSTGPVSRATFELARGLRGRLDHAVPPAGRLAAGEVPVDPEGRFEFELALPADAAEGSAELRVGLLDADGARLAELSSFLLVRKAAASPVSFSVLPSARTAALGSPLLFRADAFDGERPLPGAQLDWKVTARPARLEFPALEGFVFGAGRAAWSELDAEIEALEEPDRCRAASLPARRSALTGADGSHALRVQPRGGEPLPLEITAEARLSSPVELRATARATVYPAALVVGLRTARPFLRQGEVARIHLIAADLSGQRAAEHKIVVRAIGQRWSQHLGGWKAESVDLQECTVASERFAVHCDFRLAAKAVYRIVATVRDTNAQVSQSEIGLWVEGAAFPPRHSGVFGASLELFPERESQAAGGMARLLLRTDTPGARALLLLGAGEGLREARVVKLEEPSLFVELPLGDRSATVEALALTPEGLLSAPQAHLKIEGRHPERLVAQVKAEPVGPGRVRAQVQVADEQGRPAAGADVVLAAMDAALDQGPADDAGPAWQLPPEAFLPALEPRGFRDRARNDGCPRGASDPRRVHFGSDFLLKDAPPLPALDPAVHTWRLTTDAAGKAEVELDLAQPTTYLLRALATDPRRGLEGEAEARVALGAPLAAHLAAPRVARPGDFANVLLVLENLDGRPAKATVAARASGARLAVPAAMEVELLPGRPVEVALPLEIESPAGAALRVLVRAGRWERQLDAAIAVETDLERETVLGRFETASLSLPIAVPKRAGEKLGALHLSLSPSPLSNLSDAVLSLVERPSVETSVVASRLLALASLGSGLGALAAPGLPPASELAALAAADVARLAARQLPDGAFRSSETGEASPPFASVLAADALARAKASGLAVPEPLLARVRTMLAAVHGRLPVEPDAGDAIEAYALNVRARLGERDLEAARRVATRALEGHSTETLAWLAAPLAGDPLASQLERYLEARFLRDEAGGHYAAVYRSGAEQVLHSEHRADAVVLEALLESGLAPDTHALLAQGLLSHRAGGRWASAGENAFGVAALARLWRATGAEPRGGRAWLGGAFLGEQRFAGGHHAAQVSVPMELLIARPRNYELVMAKDGPGPLFYRLELDWADDTEDRREGGFGVERTYLAVEPRGLERDLRAGWRARSGAQIKVRLQLFVPTCSKAAVLRDALPAGFEPVGALRVLEGRSCSGRPLAPELQRGRAGLTAWLGDLGPGLHTLEYTAIAVARGDWRAPPARLSDATGTRAVGGSHRIAVE